MTRMRAVHETKQKRVIGGVTSHARAPNPITFRVSSQTISVALLTESKSYTYTRTSTHDVFMMCSDRIF